ncbi:class I SAM-dependent methyltransferase [Streptomyces sp. NRRL F-2747]|uniref:class I SAM-dependent methyltransferase n=1 Tax=Streptomyces sp. NRRL F-2747 TaxID=1463843 RepID=UPI0004C89295|nr:class I SAM-dependent methyltransferase [Streptomyces sp. NRRL F-2747]
MTDTRRQEPRPPDVWEDHAALYVRTLGAACAGTVRPLLDAVRVGPGTRVLDVGTGPGTVAAAAADRGAAVTAVDSSAAMVRLARAAAPSARTLVAALPRLPFRDGCFDVAVGNFVLGHAGPTWAVPAELRRVVRPGGRVGLTGWTDVPAAGQTLLGRALRAAGAPRPATDRLRPPRAGYPGDPAGLARLLHSAGLREAACRTIAWDHRVGADAWFEGVARLLETGLLTAAAADPASVARVVRHAAALSAPFLSPDGELRLPHVALLAYGWR